MKKLSNEIIDKRLIGRDIIRVGNFCNIRTALLWKCLICEKEWEVRPSSVIHSKNGCPHCSKKVKITNECVDNYLLERGIKRLETVLGKGVKHKWACLKCNHIWRTTFGSLKNSNSGCPKCVGLYCDNSIIDEKLRDLNNRIQRVGEYVDATVKISWKCLQCENEWSSLVSNILSNNNGCPFCNKKAFSKKAIRWLNDISKKLNINIIHAENGGEYHIPNTRFKVDGFCKETNTVYEFYGNAFHGNLNVYDEEFPCHPYDKSMSAKELFIKTLKRENILKNKGYNIISIWEDEFDKIYK